MQTVVEYLRFPLPGSGLRDRPLCASKPKLWWCRVWTDTDQVECWDASCGRLSTTATAFHGEGRDKDRRAWGFE